MMIEESLTQYISKLNGLLAGTSTTERSGSRLSLDKGAAQAAALIQSCRETGNKVLLIGNGGSAAIVSHMQNDICKALGIRALVLTETPLLTALSNDLGYKVAYQRLTELWMDEGDLMVAISSSGQSSNILGAVDAVRNGGGKVITLSGFRDDNALRTRGDINFYIRSDEYGYVELAHQVIAHYLTDHLMDELPAIR